MKNNDFVSFICGFDFVCLTETFAENVDPNLVAGYRAFFKPASKLSKPGRLSGGIVCLVRTCFLPFIKHSDTKSYKNCCVFLMDKSLFGTIKDVLFVCAYVHPEGSPFYTHFDVGNGIELLEESLFDCLIDKDVFVLLCGDLNGRTSNVSQVDYSTAALGNEYKSQSLTYGRCSQDSKINNYGKLLLNMCTSLGMNILNGVCKGDHDGRYTYIGNFGCSVDDYFIMSSELFSFVCDSCELSVVDRIESDHMPVTLSVVFPNDNVLFSSDADVDDHATDKYVWSNEYASQYHESLLLEENQLKFDAAICMIDDDIDCALNLFNECIKTCADCMKRRTFVNKSEKRIDWFDFECVLAKRNVRKLLRKYRRTLDKNICAEYTIARREYKHLLKRKEKDFHDALLNRLETSISNQKEFWGEIRRTSFRKRQPRNSISIETWFNHFKSLLEKEIIDEDISNSDNDEIDEYMNRPISREEVIFAFQKLKNRKSAGPDSIISELYKHSCDQVVDFFIKLFNTLFDRGIFPSNWTESVVLPLYKKGDVNNPNNYRGISVSDVSSKLFSTIINRRLQEWVQDNNITDEYQAGFKQGYSTIDHVFTLIAFVQKQLSMHRKLYVAFIDFEKAFDSINRNLLWPILLKNGIKGKLYKCIRSMYDNVKCKIRCGTKLTDYVKCVAGVKQGDVCSPILFTLFINELAIEVLNKGRHGVTFCTDAFELFILLLADDVVLLSETVVGLQTQLNSLQHAAHTLQLNVNMNKSNIIVFRNGGYLGKREKWTYANMTMPVVNAYKYLGILISTRLSFVNSCKDSTSKSKHALLCIMKKLSSFENVSLKLFLKIFDSQVQSIAQYGAELWGLSKAAVNCESVHLFALKKFLGVELCTPNDLIYGETNRYPIYINSAIQCIRFWFRLLHMNVHRLPRRAYNMLYDLDVKGKKNWVSDVRCCLFENGFGDVWLNQGVGNVSLFIKIFRQRLTDCNWQRWHEHIYNSDRFTFYRTVCATHDVKRYIVLNMEKHMKFITTRFRLGVSELAVHYYRYRKVDGSKLICPLCSKSKEDELHFVLCCTALDEIRKRFIPAKYFRYPSAFKLCLLMSSTRERDVRNLTLFLYKAFKYRSIVCS